MGTVRWVCFCSLMEFVSGRQPLMDESQGEELLCRSEAVDGLAVGLPVNGVDRVVGPIWVFCFEIFAETAGAEGVAQSAGEGIGYGKFVVVYGGVDARDGWCLTVAVR